MPPSSRSPRSFRAPASLRFVVERNDAPSKPRSPPRSPPASSTSPGLCGRSAPMAMYVGVLLYGGGLLIWWVFLRTRAANAALGPGAAWPSLVLSTHGGQLAPAVRWPDASAAISDRAVDSETLVQSFAHGLGAGAATSTSMELQERAGVPQLTCVGWRQTGGCSPDGPREPEHDMGCGGVVKAGSSGFCLLRDERLGIDVQVVRLNCSSLRREASFKCSQAPDFARLAPEAAAVASAARLEDQAEAEAEKQPQVESETQQLRGVDTANATAIAVDTVAKTGSEPTRGILMVVYPKLLASVYASVRLLRSQGCVLPVELWFLESELGTNPLGSSRILQKLVSDLGPVTLRGMAEPSVTGFNSKVFALAHSSLHQVLFLDADNAPVQDPSYLFESDEFQTTGAVFWPDFWHPRNTIFNVNEQSPLWELVGTPFVDMFEQESGQLLIDRTRTHAALQVLQLLALREPRHFETLKLLHGDKDLFRLAWLKTDSPFHMVRTPAAAAGMLRGSQFCGMTMVQHDLDGHVLFLHRNGKKLTGDEDVEKDRTWTHLQSFVFPDELADVKANATISQRYEYLKTYYHVAIFGGGKPFSSTRMCYGDRYLKSEHYHLTPWEELPFHDLEDRLYAFAHEASQL